MSSYHACHQKDDLQNWKDLDYIGRFRKYGKGEKE
jgi:hypothetical protein